ncbi:MAG: hypothetical protein AAB545_02765 [Patescibacteria group bacterium]
MITKTLSAKTGAIMKQMKAIRVNTWGIIAKTMKLNDFHYRVSKDTQRLCQFGRTNKETIAVFGRPLSQCGADRVTKLCPKS